MTRLPGLIVGIAILGLLLSACTGPSPVKIDESANGTSVNLEAGQTLIVTLKSNPTTGYDWQVDEMDEGVVKLVTQEFKPASDPDRLGAPGQTEFQFQAVGAGTTSLRLIYVRSWETDVEPQDTFEITITVQ
ncbi:MAG: protease inhibitor I42 family protein [Anaerolineae bacterium]